MQIKRIPPNDFRDGYRVLGGNTVDGDLECWYFPTFQLASDFAQRLSRDTGKEVEITKYLGSWRPVVAIEYFATDDI
jgi:hypothetical protein